MNSEVFIPITFFAALFGVFYLYITARNKERMALIEKGADASLFTSRKDGERRGVLSWWVLKLALLCIGVAIGVFVGNILDVYSSLEMEVCYWSSILFFGGLGLLGYYLYERSVLGYDDE